MATVRTAELKQLLHGKRNYQPKHYTVTAKIQVKQTQRFLTRREEFLLIYKGERQEKQLAGPDLARLQISAAPYQRPQIPHWQAKLP